MPSSLKLVIHPPVEVVGLMSHLATADTDAAPPELRNLAATFNRMADRLTRVLEAQQRFVGDASHQLRTPLTAKIETEQPVGTPCGMVTTT